MKRKLVVNDREFEIQEMNPFGIELRPLDGENVDILEWAGRDLEALLIFVRENALVLVKNAVSTPDQWEHIPAPDAYYSARMWHNDGQGDYPVVGWVPAEGLRNPTVFAMRDDVVDVQREMRDLLNPYTQGIDMQDRASHQLLQVYQQLGELSDQVRIQLLDRLGIYLIRLARLNRLTVRPQKGVFDPLIDVFKGFDSRDIVNEDSDLIGKRILNLIMIFTQKVTTELDRRKKLYIHRWNESPDTAVFLNNGFVSGSEDSENGPMAQMLHCRLDEEEIVDEADLYRLRLVRKDFDGTVGNLEWAIKSFPAF